MVSPVLPSAESGGESTSEHTTHTSQSVIPQSDANNKTLRPHFCAFRRNAHSAIPNSLKHDAAKALVSVSSNPLTFAKETFLKENAKPPHVVTSTSAKHLTTCFESDPRVNRCEMEKHEEGPPPPTSRITSLASSSTASSVSQRPRTVAIALTTSASRPRFASQRGDSGAIAQTRASPHKPPAHAVAAALIAAAKSAHCLQCGCG
mmetsp:Transcript_6460/g.24373  ORF Transcript_6460/g.24373 Transcript_6460/m.24373 type:complete len:205 (-) Transcript_6460:91-705(-)